MKNKLKNIIIKNKGFTLSLIFIVLLLCYVAIPTLSELKNTVPTYSVTVWDGSVALSFGGGEGTKEHPYIISNGGELAYLALQLETDDYDGKHFILTNDIVLNDGVFSYTRDDGIKYVINDEEKVIVPGNVYDSINIFKHLNNFKGYFNGNFNTIYGLYIDETIDGQNGLFTNLSGDVENLYINNSVIYGGNIVGGVVSKAIDSILTNISYDGYVIADEDVVNKVISFELDNIQQNVNAIEYSDSISINDLGYVPGIVTSVKLSGVYETDDSLSVLKINDEIVSVGEFNLNLGSKLLSNVSISYITDIESNFSLSGLKYEISYNYGNASGIISIAENTNLTNLINKANVSSSVYASGIVNTLVGKSSLKNSYNVGMINSDNFSSGIISNVNFNVDDIVISNCYNNGSLNSDNNSMIGNIENNIGSITLMNIFNVQDEYVIDTIVDTNVNVSNSYVVSDKIVKNGLINDEFIVTSLYNLKNREFVRTYLKFGEYDELENNVDNVWVWSFENDVLPILYIDELNQPIANIHIKEFLWNSYNNKVDMVYFSDKIVFSVAQADLLNKIDEIYYYVSNDENGLTNVELNNINDWIKYEDIVEIANEGSYIIYVKIIDSNNNIIYINTDMLVLDWTVADVEITSSFNDSKWNGLKENVSNYYVNQKLSIEVNVEDSLSGINKIYYYLSDKVISNEDIVKVDEWNEYLEPIIITDSKMIVYVKVLDNSNNVVYANTDLIIINGYVLKSMAPGMSDIIDGNLYINDKSSVSLNFTYSDINEYAYDSRHQLVSNVLFPIDTKITLIDKLKNKVYVYTTNDDDYGYNDCIDEVCEVIYDFSLFNEVGSKNKFNESNYTGIIDEDFIVLLDFSDSKIDSDIEDIILSLRINSSNNNEIRNTLVNDDNKFNIICDSDVSFNLSSSFDDTINYNENAQYIIDFVTKMNYKTINDNIIFDTRYDDKNIGLSIKMVDDNGQVVGKQYLKNIVFKVGDKKYSPSSNGEVRINLDKGINDISDSLIIQTYSDNSNLKSGNYKFIISLYTAYDGVYSNENLSSIEIPVYVGKNIYNVDSNFNVIMNNEDRIITTKENEFNFEFLVGDVSENYNIKMLLYKKDSLSAYDQKYTLVDLGEYLIDNNFLNYSENVYYALNNISGNDMIDIKLNTALLEKKGYMFVFELYDGEKLINRVNKKFIVK